MIHALTIEEGMMLSCSEDLTLLVGKVDVDVAQNVGQGIHVQMYRSGAVFAGHLPFAVQALSDCGVGAVGRWSSQDRAAFEEGWEVWDEAKGGYFSIPPTEVAELIAEQTGQ